MSRGRVTRPVLVAAAAMVLVTSCSANPRQTLQADPAPTATAAVSTPSEAITPGPSSPPSTRPPPTTTPDQEAVFFDELLSGLENLGITADHATCILGLLQDRGADPRALEVGEMDSVMLLDEASLHCLVDLARHIEMQGM